MENKKASPGVYALPPLFYVFIFPAASFVQKKVSIDNSFFHLQITKFTGIFMLIISLFFLDTRLKIFFQSKNTLILIKPVASLQTNGIYKISRKPMYLGLAIVYLGLTFLMGNWWDIILFPLLLLIIQDYIIKRKERYLERAFAQGYLNYKLKVRRWL